ncbi:MAG: T9SS C-terminal target domain-containing protein [Ignavibacteriae bacterium]|nr:MAG: T9SS C-terminal target domain-containing protein [Ignavibacteriota bacterium]
MKKILFILVLLLSYIYVGQINSQWQILSGPSGAASWIINPKPNVFIVRTDVGLFKSTDGTSTWYPLRNGPGNLFRPTGTTLSGQGDKIIFSVYGHVIGAARIYLSTDCGENWVTLSGAQRMSSAAFKDNYIFYSRSVSGSGQDGIFRSSDNGLNWNYIPPFNASGKLFVKDNYVFYHLGDSLFRSANNGDSWEFIYKGFLKSFCNYNNFIIAGNNNYFYKSSNYGVNWDTNYIGFNIERMIQLNNNIYAADSWDFGFKYSTDAGITWQNVSDSVPVSTDFCAEGNSLYVSDNGILKSTNYGNNWIFRGKGVTSLSIYKVFCDNNNIFAFNNSSISISNDNGESWSNIYDNLIPGGNQTFSAVNGNYFVATDSGIYKSTNNGINWANITGSIPWSTGGGNTVGSAFGQLYFYSPAAGLLKSTNLGISWITLPVFPGTGINYFMEHNNNLFVYTTEIHGLYRSSDMGNSWLTINNGITDTSVAIRGLTFSGNDLYCVTAYMAFKSMDEGNTWINVQNGINAPSPSFRGITASQGNVCIASYRNGVYVTSNGGANWILTNNGLLNDYVYSITSTNTHVFTSTAAGADYESGVYRAPAGGLFVTYSVSGNVSYADNSLPVSTGYVKALKYDRVNDLVITLDSTQILSNGNYVLPKVPQDTTYIMAYDDDEEFVPTYHDSSINWQNATVVIPTGNMTGVDIMVYRIVNSFINMHIGGGVFKTEVSPYIGIKDAIVYATAFGQYRGYSISNSNGAYQIDSLFPGLYQMTCDRLGYNFQTKNITLTYYNSDTTSFYLTLFTDVKKISTGIPLEYKLDQCFPNPFNPVTTIRFEIPKTSVVKLVIYDILGREAAVLIDEKLNTGIYNAEWDASALSSGVYFYRFSADDFVSTKKMVLLK